MCIRDRCEIIRSAERIPVRRNTIYKTIDIYKDHDPIDITPLVERKSDPLNFLKMFPETAE